MKKILIYISVAILVIACGKKSPDTGKNQPEETLNETIVNVTAEQEKTAGIKLGKAENRSLSGIIRANGTIDVPPQNMVSVCAPLGGYLRSTRLLPGMPVNRGEVIASMEDPQYIQLQQDLLTAKAQLKMNEAEYNRQAELNKSKAGSDKAFQQAEAAYRSQKILIQALAEKLKLIGINPDLLTENNLSRAVPVLSPITGFVSKVNVNIGKYVNPTDVLFELVNPADIHLNIRIYEKDLNQIKTGQKVLAWTNTVTNVKYPCEIILIGQDIRNDKSVEVHCHFEKYDRSLIPGMYMNAEIQVSSGESLTLPESAVMGSGENRYCFVKKAEGTYALTPVKTGLSSNGFVAITIPGIPNPEQTLFVTEGAYSLWMKLKNKEE